MAITLTTEQALRPFIIEGIVNKEAEQQLDFKNIFPEIRTDALGFTYMKDTTTAGDDISSGKMGKPVDMGEMSELSEIDVSPISLAHGSMEVFGYKIKVSQRSLREASYVDELLRAYQRAGFGIAKKKNDDILAKLIAETNEVTEVGGGAAWNADDADPINDIIKFQEAFDLEGYPFELDTIFLHKTNFYELQKYMTAIDRDWGLNPRNERKLPPLMGVTFRNTHSTQMTEGDVLGLDSRYPAATIYKYMDPKKSAFPNESFIMVNKFVEDEHPQNIVIELTAEMGIAIKEPNAKYYYNNGI
jgi:hypothetical protein